MASTPRYAFFIDRGGTFTDCLMLDRENGDLRSDKVLSSDRAPLVGIRSLLGLAEDAPIPPCDVRMGTTLATNALLERAGARTALLITEGFADLLVIGDQTRPDLFALHVQRPRPLYERVVELRARSEADGETLLEPDEADARAQLRVLREAGIESLAIAFVHAYRNPELELRVAEWAVQEGFTEVYPSHGSAPELGFLSRTSTTVVDAYLTPMLRRYLAALSVELPGSSLRVMQSGGGLVGASEFFGRNAILSGPAGGAVAMAHIARECGQGAIIGFDMGGTSTDVSRYAGELERIYEGVVAGAFVRAPMMDIHTVASGGGSLCRYDGHSLTVGPESAGAVPGPLCYGHEDARELALTDINVMLGRLPAARFPFPLNHERPKAALQRIADALREAGDDRAALDVAEGFFHIAIEQMAEAITKISLSRGHDVREHALLAFGGAAGQTACAVARRLGMKTIVFHPHAGILSAFGMGVAQVAVDLQQDAGRIALPGGELPKAVHDALTALERDGRARLADEARGRGLQVTARLDLRYAGTQSPLTLPVAPAETLRARFESAHKERFGYSRPQHTVEIMAARVEVATAPSDFATPTAAEAQTLSVERHPLYFNGTFVDAQVIAREALRVGEPVPGPAIVLDRTTTIVVEPDFTLTMDPRGILTVQAQAQVTRQQEPARPAGVNRETGGETAANDEVIPEEAAGRQRGGVGPRPARPAGVNRETGEPEGISCLARGAERSAPSIKDPVLLQVFGNAFMSIAEQMGLSLQRTAMSTNIRERRDFSCAVFDGQGGLVANAPHIPVHLGAMGESVKAVLAAHPRMQPGDVFVTNDPACGGSHLPDITVVTPVFDADGVLRFFCASRGHHADIGGIAPGSMPPHSTTLAEEGVVLSAEFLVRAGNFDEAALHARLTAGPYPARKPQENIADLQAQMAANRVGARLLLALCERRSLDTVLRYMGHVQEDAELCVREAIAALPDGEFACDDTMDDGTRIAVRMQVEADVLHVDFTGCSPQVAGNLNAPRAVTLAAVLYVLRCLAGRPIPLNGGCLRPISLNLPEGCVLSPREGAAVVAGNVETSQRVVDVMLAALGKLAASQGTMNNLSFGDQSFGYYETIAGGMGAGPDFDGESAVHSHMTNTRITDVEVMEENFPVRLWRFAVRQGSGGKGARRGGDGVIREFEALSPLTVSILSDRRTRGAFGLQGGEAGAPGQNLRGARQVPGRTAFEAAPGERFALHTPGGGGYGRGPR